MDIKLVFLTVAAVTLTYSTEVSKNDLNSFSAMACQNFPIKQKELYHFVTFPDIANKWLKWISYFSAADHRPLGIGKMYKTIIKNFVMYFKVTDFHDGKFIVIESNFPLRPRVELIFTNTNGNYKKKNNNNYSNYYNADANIDADGDDDVENIENDGDDNSARNSRRNLNIQHCRCKTNNSELIIKLYFQRNSLLFQYTLGLILRAIFQHLFRESMENLQAILEESTTCPNLFVSL